MTLEIAPNGADPLAKLAGLTALEACGYLADRTAAPPPVIAYAKSFAHAVVSIAKTLRLLRTSDPAVVHNALSRLAREGLIPGDVGDATSTGYLFIGKGNVLAAEPNPRGRLACARAAGVEVRAVPIHKDDVISLNGDGDVDTDKSTLKPDPRPTKWDHVKGVMLHVDDLHTGARRSLWVSASEIGVRKAQAGGQGVWNKDGVSMACTKAIKIAIARGAIPQASLIPSILAACAAPAATRPLAIEAQPAPRQLAEPAPVAEPEPSGLNIYTALAEVRGQLGNSAPDDESMERAVSKQFALLQIASRTTGETVDRDSLTHEQHRKMVAGALADLAPAKPDQTDDEAPPAEPEPEQAGQSFTALVDDLSAEAECGTIAAEATIDSAITALAAAGKPHGPADLRSPKLWARLIERAAQAARAAD